MPTISIHIDADAATKLLAEFGWSQNERGQWVAPNGWTTWAKDEAVAQAINSRYATELAAEAYSANYAG